MRKPWTAEDVDKLIKLSVDHSHEAIAAVLGRKWSSVKHKYTDLANKGLVRKRTTLEGASNILVTSQNDALMVLPHRYLDMMKAEVDKALVISDIHLPCVDWELFENLLRVSKRQGVRTCVVGGDLFDLALFSRFPDSHAHGPEELTMGQQAAIKFFSMLLDQFEKVYVICGNHDFRIFGFTQGKITENQFFRFMTNISNTEKRVEFSAYRHMVLNERTRVVHPNGGGAFYVEGTREAVKYQQNILLTHIHKMGWCFDPSGRLMVVGTGALLDPTTQAYVMTIPSGSPMWNTGGVIMQGSRFYLYPKYHTDWDKWTKTRFL